MIINRWIYLTRVIVHDILLITSCKHTYYIVIKYKPESIHRPRPDKLKYHFEKLTHSAHKNFIRLIDFNYEKMDVDLFYKNFSPLGIICQEFVFKTIFR